MKKESGVILREALLTATSLECIKEKKTKQNSDSSSYSSFLGEKTALVTSEITSHIRKTDLRWKS
jgi:hypothetical protein